MVSFSACSGSSSRSKNTADDTSETGSESAVEETTSQESSVQDDSQDTSASIAEETEEKIELMSSDEFVDYMFENYDVPEVAPGDFYSDILNPSELAKGMLCNVEGSGTIDYFEKSYVVASRAGTLPALDLEDWMVANIQSLTQYSRYSMQSEDGNLQMTTESVTLYDYSDEDVARKVFTNVMKRYEPYGLYVESLSEEEYGLEGNSGHFIIAFGLEEYIHLLDMAEDIDIISEDGLDGGGTQGKLFNEYTKAVGIYLRGSRITIVSFSSTMGDESVISDLTSLMDLEDPFRVKSSSEVLELLIER